MAPIQPLEKYTPSLKERAHLYTKKEQENAGWVLLGIICAAGFFAIMYIMIKKYREEWGKKVESLKHTYSDWKASKASKEPKKPQPAHVANNHTDVSEIPYVDRITENLTPEYRKKTTATLHG